MKGIILINFGGPRFPDEIKPFLRDIFADVLPWPLKFLARFLAWLREPYAKKMYDTIGSASPVVSWTVKQGAELGKKLGAEYRIYTGMKYGSPSVADAIKTARDDGCDKIITLPLFPYGSRYTTSMSLRALLRNLVNAGDCFVAYAPRNDTQFHTHPLYISAMADIIRSALSKMGHPPPPQTDLIFSVHAIPLKAAKEEPYVRQVHESVAEIMKQFTGYNYHIAFQSQTGPIRWTRPSVKNVLKHISTYAPFDFAQGRLTHLRTYALIIPLGFACENIETLYEIDYLYIPYAKKMGLENIARTLALNDNPQFIDLLAELILRDQ